MVDRLDIQSGVGRRMLLASELMTAKEEVERELLNLQHVFDLLDNGAALAASDRIRVKLAQIRDIKGSLKNLERRQVLDDIELFEVKHYAIVANEIREVAISSGISPIDLPNIEGVIALLDPDGNRIPSFYIYDAYSAGLTAIRKEIKKQPTDGDISHLLGQANAIEDAIRERLSNELQAMVDRLKQSLERTGRLDILIAKARQAKEMMLVRPTLSDRVTAYQGFFNPQLKELLEQQGRHYQPVDLSLDRSICLITGANMAGKTVMLKTVALCQYLCQFGFFVPAAKASVCLVNRIMTCIGDDQSEQKGLSAFAAEILTISHIVTAAKSDKKLLVLIDELARTTNPTEGKAIVSATANLLNGMGIRGIITTHYSGVKTDCHRLRVRGFIDGIAEAVTIDNLSRFIDYSLVDDDSGIVPQEALRIASLLGVDDELLGLAQKAMDEDG